MKETTVSYRGMTKPSERTYHKITRESVLKNRLDLQRTGVITFLQQYPIRIYTTQTWHLWRGLLGDSSTHTHTTQPTPLVIKFLIWSAQGNFRWYQVSSIAEVENVLNALRTEFLVVDLRKIVKRYWKYTNILQI